MRPFVLREIVPRAALPAALLVLAFGPNAAAQQGGLQVSSQPALYPTFDPAVTDYVVRCVTGTSIDVTVSAPPGTTAAVDGQGARRGDFTVKVSVNAGQAFRIVQTAGSATQTYHVRCIPADFPRWTFERTGSPQAEWYGIAPFSRTDFQPIPPGISRDYVALFDGNGVPVWWMKTPALTIDFRAFPNGNVAWALFDGSRAEERRLNGSLVRAVAAVAPITDPHEVVLLPNGNYVLISQRTLTGSACGQSNVTILDDGVQEVTPTGSLVWSWWVSDHIPMSEIPAAWCPQVINSFPRDVTHVNAVEVDGDGFLVSFRHLDAVYRIARSDGSIDWKLGGTQRPESLTTVGDPFGADALRGQHEPRVLPDGTVTVHDNGFHPGSARTPRAVRYAIDESARTATLVEQKNDPQILSTAVCCGSARKLPGGNWVMAWGSAGPVTELSPAGGRVFRLSFEDRMFTYRAHPVPFGLLSRDALREGMDAQAPRGSVRPRGTPRMQIPLVPAAKPCTSPDRVHGGPLAFGSCSSPELTSDHLTVGTPDANGVGANSTGSVGYRVRIGDPATPENESDVRMDVQLTDVRRQANLSDYTGQLQMRPAVRITDRLNGSLQNEAATGLDTEFPATVPCTATANAGMGAICSLSTSFNALVPGVAVDGKRANWELGQIRVFDGGAGEVAGSTGATLFAVQGVGVP